MAASYADGSTVGWSYDAGNRLTQVQDSTGGTITRTYDPFDRVLSETTAQGVVSTTYDAIGRRLTLQAPGQAQVGYGYDAVNRLTGITQGATTVQFGYDATGRRTYAYLPGGISASYVYDNASQLLSITYSTGLLLGSAAPATDAAIPAGPPAPPPPPTGPPSSGGVATSTPGPALGAGRLVGQILGTLTYMYDAAGRIVARGGTLFQSVLPQAVTSATYDLGNRLTQRIASGITTTPSWDANGSLTSDGLRQFVWDARGRLTSIPGVASYRYDAFGRRSMATPGRSAATSYLYDGADVVQEQQNGAVSANLLTGAGVDERFARTGSGAGNSGTYLTDALGSTVALAGADGVATNYGYDPYGVSSASGAANGSTYQFAGRENDGTGLYFNRARYYNPGWGRFISEDPIGLRGGINVYAYAGNNPVSLTDPSGLSATTSATDFTSAPSDITPPATASSAPGTPSASEPPATGSPSDGAGGGSIELPNGVERSPDETDGGSLTDSASAGNLRSSAGSADIGGDDGPIHETGCVGNCIRTLGVLLGLLMGHPGGNGGPISAPPRPPPITAPKKPGEV